MRVRWVKVWVDAMASLTERFRDEEGRVDFEALGREEYAFRHALVTGDFSRSERARDLYDATINEITSRSEAGRKGAEARWSRNTAAATTREGVDVVHGRESGSLERTTGCNISQEAPTSNAGDESSDAGNGAALKSATSCNQLTADGDIREDSLNVTDGSNSGALESATSANPMRRVPQNEAPAHGFSGGRTAQGTMSRSPEAAAQSGKAYDQEATPTSTISPDASDCKAEGVVSHGEPITRNGSRANRTSATSGQTFEALEQPRAGEVLPESVSAKPSPALPVPAKRPHGEFGNVMLTDDEFAKLCKRFSFADTVIEEADQYFEAQPAKKKKYKNHYAMLLNWCKRRETEAKPQQRYKNINDINQENYEKAMREIEAMCAGEAV